jgi:hypothetical protein
VENSLPEPSSRVRFAATEVPRHHRKSPVRAGL